MIVGALWSNDKTKRWRHLWIFAALNFVDPFAPKMICARRTAPYFMKLTLIYSFGNKLVACPPVFRSQGEVKVLRMLLRMIRN